MNLSPAPLKSQCASGWFAAGKMMARALTDLSDGAFKLFVYLCLHASRQTGSLNLPQAKLASQLGKSRRSIGLYLAELEQHGYCSVQTCHNQHVGGNITIADAYWPYQRSHTELALDPQAAFVHEVKKMFLALVPGTAAFSAADHRLACRWFSQSIPLDRVEKAFLLGSVRKQLTRVNRQDNTPIRSLHYFQALLEEVRQLKVAESYWIHLRRRLERLTQPSRALANSSTQTPALAPQPPRKEPLPC